MKEIQTLENLLSTFSTETHLRAGRNNQYVAALQTLLNLLGFGKELQWAANGANGSYDNNVVQAVRAFGIRNGFNTNGRFVTASMLLRLLDQASKAKPVNPPVTDPVKPPVTDPVKPPVSSNALQITDEGATLRISDGQLPVSMTKRGPGLVHPGKISIEQAIDRDRNLLVSMGVTPSEINVMKAVSANEGKLDAINTYDVGVLSFGIYQWALGSGKTATELPALLYKIKQKFPDAFQRFFGAFGLDATLSTDTSGFLWLNANMVDTPEEKGSFRTPEWAYRFWRAGQDPQVQSVEIEHALSRLDTFYRSPRYTVKGFLLSDIITSEYGVALVLDHHVNRPAFVQPCVELAMNNTGLPAPGTWGTAEEGQLLEAYIDIRATYARGNSTPMADAHLRASKTQAYISKGIISAERHSFGRLTV